MRSSEYELHPIITNDKINLSRHELGHFWMAHLCGFEAHGLALSQDHGGCTISYPLEAADFSAIYAESPLRAAGWLVRTLAVIRAGCYVEIVGDQVGQELRGQDLDDTARWREHVVGVYGVDGWTKAYAASYQALQSWYRHAQVKRVFRECAPAVARQQTMSRYGPTALKLRYDLIPAYRTGKTRMAASYSSVTSDNANSR